MLQNKKQNNKGFTLVEMLVAIAVFMTVMTVAVGSLLSIIEANRKAQAIKSVIDNLNFAIETISRDMEVSTKYSCSPDSGNLMSFVNSDCSDGGTAIQYKQSSNTYVQYRFLVNPSPGDGNLQRRICTEVDCTLGEKWQSITAPTSTLQITNMKFYVLGTIVGDNKQPRVLITVEGIAGEKPTDKTDFTLQTTVSQRLLMQLGG